MSVLAAFLFLGWAGTPLVWADTESPWKKFTIKAGGYFPFNDSSLQITGKKFGLGLGTKIDLEESLLLKEEHAVFRIDAEWRYFPRHRINVSYFDLSREAVSALTATITVGNKMFAVGDVVASEFK